MNATKRKFNSLLQGLGSPSRPASADNEKTMNVSARPTTATPNTNESVLQKRQRLGLDGPPTITGGLNQPKPSVTNIVRRWGSQTDKTKDRSDSAAKYSPADRQELLKRLGTFQELTDWTPKPERVSEVEWAKRGWVCQGKERVRCVLCHKELVVKLNRKEVDGKEVAVLVPSEVEDALVDKYVELMVSSHQEDCLWRRRGCEDSLLRLSLASATASLEALRLRYDELCARKPFLPHEFNLRLPEDMKLDDILSHFPHTFFTDPAPTEASPASPNRTALALALLGWQGLVNPRIGAVPNSASCHTCQRRLGLWMFKSKEVDDKGEILVPAPMDHLDAVREHRFFCPWKNAQAQSRGGQAGSEADLPGWKVLAQTIRNEAHLQGVYAGRPNSKVRPGENVPPSPATPRSNGADPLRGNAEGSDEDDTARDAKDKERWARLRRVKSLFDSKGGKKLRRPLSRPGTSHSTVSAKEKE